MISSLYTKLPHDTPRKLEQCLDRGLGRGAGEAKIFFRADDIGVPGKQFIKLIQLFHEYRMPLCLATVPAWLTSDRFQALEQVTGTHSSQWCWHQHGWRHRNYEFSGKKQEFGSARPAERQVGDLKKGKERLQGIMGDSFAPFFTPPWNRCSQETLEGLEKLGFLAVSRSRNAHPPSSATLPDLQINIDLHTRKEPDPERGFQAFLQELEKGIGEGRGGVMIHHQRMDDVAFDFLGKLLSIIRSKQQLHPVGFREMI